MDGEILMDEAEVGNNADEKRGVRGKQVIVGPAAISGDNKVGEVGAAE